MNTLLFETDEVNPNPELIRKAAALIRSGELVAFPTETVYGLGGDGLNALSAERIFLAKGRPSDNPLILHIAGWKQLEQLAMSLPATAYALSKVFWPGPLTFVLERNPIVPDTVTGGRNTVAVRMPDHPVALALIREAKTPIAAPSANLSGKPSPTTAQHVFEDLNGRIAAIVDAGPTRIGLESTVVDLTTPVPTVLRPGGVSLDELRTVVPETVLSDGAHDAKSPGTKYRHYSPNAAVNIVFNTETAHAEASILQHAGKRVGWIGQSACDNAVHLLFPNDAAFYARFYFAALRDLDQQGVDAIFVEPIQETGLGAAVMDRVLRSAGYKDASSD